MTDHELRPTGADQIPGALMASTLDAARLRVGVTLWLASEAMFFAALFGAYFTLRATTAVWPPGGTHLDTTRSAVFTAILIASSGTMRLAERRLESGDRQIAYRMLIVTIGLGAIFLVNQILEYSSIGFSIDSHPYGSIFFVLTGFHGLHVLGGLVYLAIIAAGVRSIGLGGSLRMARVGAMYWHFVDVVWIVLFVILFLIR